MAAFLIRRSWQVLLTLLGITILTFLIMHLAPGEPTDVQTMMNPRVSAQARENLKRLYGLDKPLHVQYLDWAKRFVTLDFGTSFADGRAVTTIILERLPITVAINLLALLITLAIALPLGVLSATQQDTPLDKGLTLFVFLGFSTPGFWLALLLMIFFGVYLGWLPISGYQSINVSGMVWWERLLDWGWHIALPVCVIAFRSLAVISRYTRSEMLEVIRQDYIRTARAKGLDEGAVVYKHALRNALIPIVTILGLDLPGLIGGSVILETVFAIPGMGKLFFDAIMARDYPIIMGMTVFGAVLTLAGNLMADISYALANPKIRLTEKEA